MEPLLAPARQAGWAEQQAVRIKNDSLHCQASGLSGIRVHIKVTQHQFMFDSTINVVKAPHV